MTVITKLIIGLGNPDKKYENTYHNVGYLFVDYLNEEEKKEGWIKKPFAIRSKSYMNNSGAFVHLMMEKEKVENKEILIVHDDSDLEIGKYKLSSDRGAAGHHGVESVIASLKTKNFLRLRIGIRPPEKLAPAGKRLKAEKFVLKKISKVHSEILKETFSKILLESRLN